MVFWNLGLGQNGFLTAGLFGAATFCRPPPVVAGLPFGGALLQAAIRHPGCRSPRRRRAVARSSPRQAFRPALLCSRCSVPRPAGLGPPPLRVARVCTNPGAILFAGMATTSGAARSLAPAGWPTGCRQAAASPGGVRGRRGAQPPPVAADARGNLAAATGRGAAGAALRFDARNHRRRLAHSRCDSRGRRMGEDRAGGALSSPLSATRVSPAAGMPVFPRRDCVSHCRRSGLARNGDGAQDRDELPVLVGTHGASG